MLFFYRWVSGFTLLFRFCDSLSSWDRTVEALVLLFSLLFLGNGGLSYASWTCETWGHGGEKEGGVESSPNWRNIIVLLLSRTISSRTRVCLWCAEDVEITHWNGGRWTDQELGPQLLGDEEDRGFAGFEDSRRILLGDQANGVRRWNLRDRV